MKYQIAHKNGGKVESVSGVSEMVKRSTDLVRPEDITDAVDGDDLLKILVDTNLVKIEQKVDKRIRVAWVSEENKRIRATYFDKALKAYQKIWVKCGGSSIGHNNRNIDQGGVTVHQCDDCKFVSAKSDKQVYEVDRAKSMNETLVKSMADRMIELDVEANVLAWPTEDDYDLTTLPATLTVKKKGLFR